MTIGESTLPTSTQTHNTRHRLFMSLFIYNIVECRDTPQDHAEKREQLGVSCRQAIPIAILKSSKAVVVSAVLAAVTPTIHAVTLDSKDYYKQ